MRPSQLHRLSVGATQAASERLHATIALLHAEMVKGHPTFCGDGSTDAPNEACDDANSNNYDACRNDCSALANVAMAFWIPLTVVQILLGVPFAMTATLPAVTVAPLPVRLKLDGVVRLPPVPLPRVLRYAATAWSLAMRSVTMGTTRPRSCHMANCRVITVTVRQAVVSRVVR